jgi:hypothetical protein
MSRELWSDAYLEQSRHVGDPEADDVVEEVFEHRQLKELNTFIGSLSGLRGLPADLPPEIRDFVVRTAARPDWVKDMHLRQAEYFFTRHGLGAMLALVCASLPECYTMRKGVRILSLTRQLGAHVDRRLHQTALMVLAVMQPHGLDRGGAGIAEAQKVRLLHAAIRRLILLGVTPAQAPADLGAAPGSIAHAMAREGFIWDLGQDGYPLNQEDLAFTLLTFGYIIPLGMSRFGVRVSDEEHAAFLHAWNVTGSYLGVRRELLADTPEDAAFLYERIKARQAGPTPDGAFLTGRLLKFMEQDVLRLRLLRPLAPVLVRVLAGNETAHILGIDTRHNAGVRLFQRTVVTLVRGINRVAMFLGRFHPLRALGTVMGRDTIRFLERYTADRSGARLAIPIEWTGVQRR